jgi:hypothetical protein
MASSMVKKVVAVSGAKSLHRSEMPETPGLKLPQGKISTATRKRLVVNGAASPKES